MIHNDEIKADDISKENSHEHESCSNKKIDDKELYLHVSELAVKIVVAEFVICWPVRSKSCAIYPPYKAIAIAVAKPFEAPLVILLMLIAFTANVIVPDVVIGVPLTVNSDEPLSATATLVTVPV